MSTSSTYLLIFSLVVVFFINKAIVPTDIKIKNTIDNINDKNNPKPFTTFIITNSFII